MIGHVTAADREPLIRPSSFELLPSASFPCALPPHRLLHVRFDDLCPADMRLTEGQRENTRIASVLDESRDMACGRPALMPPRRIQAPSLATKYGVRSTDYFVLRGVFPTFEVLAVVRLVLANGPQCPRDILRMQR